MRLPRIRLGLPRLSFDWLGGVINRAVLLYGAFTLVLFLIFLVVNFPHDILVRRVVSQMDVSPLQLDFKSAHFAWYNGYELRGVRLSPPGADDSVPLLEWASVDVLPDLAGLVRGQLTGVSWQGSLYGGNASGRWKVVGKGGSGQVELSKLELGRYRVLTALFDEGQLSGQVSGSFAVQLAGGDRHAAQVSGDVTILRPALVAAKIKGFKVPDLQFALAKGKLSLKGDRLEVQEFRATGDQLNLQISGQIVLREPAANSTVNVRVTVEPSAATPDAIKGLLALIPRPAGTRPDAPITISGTLAAPQIR